MMPAVRRESRFCCVRVCITCLIYALLVLICVSTHSHVYTSSVVTLAAFHFYSLRPGTRSHSYLVMFRLNRCIDVPTVCVTAGSPRVGFVSVMGETL